MVIPQQFKKFVQFIKFCFVGGFGYLINAFSLYLLGKVIHLEFLVWALATMVAIVCIFILNSLWTFNDGLKHSFVEYRKKFIIFFSTSLGALLIQAILGPLCVFVWGQSYRQIILIGITGLVVAPYNWYMYTRVVWKKLKK